MAHKQRVRRPPIVINPPNPTSAAPATFIFIHGYNDSAASYARDPPNDLAVAHHIHQHASLQHVKIILPEGIQSRHPTVRRRVWYDTPVAMPLPGKPTNADEHIEFGHSNNNRDDMNETLDSFEELIDSEIANGTPASRIVMMGWSQGAGMVVLFLQTRKIASGLAAVISQAGFPPTDLQSVFGMQQDHGMVGRWSKETKVFVMHGKQDIFIPEEIFWAWLRQLEGFRDRGQGIASIERKLIDGVQHPMHKRVWPHVGEILDRVVPEKFRFKL